VTRACPREERPDHTGARRTCRDPRPQQVAVECRSWSVGKLTRGFVALKARAFHTLRLVVGSLKGRYVELHHRHHGVHHGLHPPGIPVTDQLGESPRDNLPREAERILDPAARGRHRPGPDELVPILVDFGLVLAVDIERHAFGEREVRAPL
jgi:hypothetical protein